MHTHTHTHTSLQHEIAHTHMALLLAGVMAAGNYIGPICPDGTYDCVQTIYEAIAELNSKGTTTLVDDPAKVDDGVAAAKDADVVVLLASNAKDGGGEGHDRYTIGLASDQEAFAQAILKVRD